MIVFLGYLWHRFSSLLVGDDCADDFGCKPHWIVLLEAGQLLDDNNSICKTYGERCVTIELCRRGTDSKTNMLRREF